jgi:hypothetical protein
MIQISRIDDPTGAGDAPTKKLPSVVLTIRGLLYIDESPYTLFQELCPKPENVQAKTYTIA